MFLLNFLIIILSFNNFANTCNFFESKKLCECGVIYTKGFDEQKKLFDLSSLEICGLNLECNEFNCAEKCLLFARKVLGDSEYDVTIKTKNKICELALPDETNNSIFRNGLTVWSTWKYSGCGNGMELIAEDICCNRKCNCKINSQLVSSHLNETFKTLIDLTSLLPIKERAYECSTLSELDDCQTDCMGLISNYFNEPIIKNLNSSILNYNIFYKEFASDKICREVLNVSINKPGIDIYAQIDASASNFSIKYVSLGRICCKQSCDCEYVYKDAYTSDSVIPNRTIKLAQPISLAYECSDELETCMEYCRKQALSVVSITNPSLDQSQPMSDLQLFSNSKIYANSFCESINQESNNSAGFNIYLKYKNAINSFPWNEDIHLGRICCKLETNKYVAIPNCE